MTGPVDCSGLPSLCFIGSRRVFGWRPACSASLCCNPGSPALAPALGRGLGLGLGLGLRLRLGLVVLGLELGRSDRSSGTLSADIASRLLKEQRFVAAGFTNHDAALAMPIRSAGDRALEPRPHSSSVDTDHDSRSALTSVSSRYGTSRYDWLAVSRDLSCSGGCQLATVSNGSCRCQVQLPLPRHWLNALT